MKHHPSIIEDTFSLLTPTADRTSCPGASSLTTWFLTEPSMFDTQVSPSGLGSGIWIKWIFLFRSFVNDAKHLLQCTYDVNVQIRIVTGRVHRFSIRLKTAKVFLWTLRQFFWRSSSSHRCESDGSDGGWNSSEWNRFRLNVKLIWSSNGSSVFLWWKIKQRKLLPHCSERAERLFKWFLCNETVLHKRAD